jgi:hypothetical protein
VIAFVENYFQKRAGNYGKPDFSKADFDEYWLLSGKNGCFHGLGVVEIQLF